VAQACAGWDLFDLTWGPVHLIPDEAIAASGHATTDMLVRDHFVEYGRFAPWATANRHGRGHVVLIGAGVSYDYLLERYPDNARWISNLMELLKDRTQVGMTMMASPLTIRDARTAPARRLQDHAPAAPAANAATASSVHAKTKLMQASQQHCARLLATKPTLVDYIVIPPRWGNHPSVEHQCRPFPQIDRYERSSELQARLHDLIPGGRTPIRAARITMPNTRRRCWCAAMVAGSGTQTTTSTSSTAWACGR
jgi:glutathione S-transferase